MQPVFISYAKEDVAAARNIYEYINQETEFSAWLDEEFLLPGMDWESEIMQAMQAAELIILIISTNSLSKTGFVQKEMKKALDRTDYLPSNRIFIIPIKINECSINDPKLSKIQHIDFYKDQNKGRLLLKKSFEHIQQNQQSKLEKKEPLFKEIDSIKNKISIIEEPEINLTQSFIRDFSGKNLMDCDFQDQDLSNVNFKGANLVGANFIRAKLNNCNFSYANLERVDFTRCDMENANFNYSNFWGAKLYAVKNLRKIASCEHINLFKIRGISFDDFRISTLARKIHQLSDYAAFIEFYCSELKINYREFVQLFEWMKTDHFLEMFTKEHYLETLSKIGGRIIR